MIAVHVYGAARCAMLCVVRCAVLCLDHFMLPSTRGLNN